MSFVIRQKTACEVLRSLVRSEMCIRNNTLPSGPLRENINNLKSYENVFLNGNKESLITIKKQIKKINPNMNINSGKYTPLNIGEFDKDQNYLVFSGIGITKLL